MLLIFDFDGVLADSLPLMLTIAEQVCHKLGFNRHPTPADLEALERMQFSELGRQLDLPLDKIEDFSKQCIDAFNNYQGIIPIFPGMKEALLKLSEKSKIAIITGNSQITVQRFLSGHQLEGVVDLISGIEEPGGRADKIRMMLDKLQGTPELSYMIGDAVSDIQAAREAGVKSIAVGWGHQSKARLIAEQPDRLAETPEDLLYIIAELSGEFMTD